MILGFLSFLKIKEQTHLGIHVCKWKFYFIKKKKEILCNQWQLKRAREIESIPLKETRVSEEVNAICAIEEGGERRVFDCVFVRQRKRERKWE